MARDYAPRRSNGRSRGSSMPGWVWMFVGLTFGLLVAAGIYIRKPVVRAEPETQATAPAPQSKTAPAKPETDVDRDSRFDFYEMLPKAEVLVPSKDYQPTPDAPPAVKQPGQYMIQAGAFRTAEDAERLKANIALLGIESSIKQVTNPDKAQTWYRVLVGPEKNLSVVNEQLRLMRENKIDGMLIRINAEEAHKTG